MTPLAAPLTLILLGIGEWAAAQALAVAMPHLALQVAFSYAIFPGVSVVVAGFYWQSRVYAGYRARPTRRTVLLLGAEPVLVSLTAATNGWHGLFFSSIQAGPAGTLSLQPGPLYWIHTAYSYLLISIGTLLVIRAMLRTVAGQRRAFTAFLLGGLAPTAANLVVVFSSPGALKVDLTSVAFLITAGVWWWTERGEQPARAGGIRAGPRGGRRRRAGHQPGRDGHRGEPSGGAAAWAAGGETCMA